MSILSFLIEKYSDKGQVVLSLSWRMFPTNSIEERINVEVIVNEEQKKKILFLRERKWLENQTSMPTFLISQNVM